MSDILAHYASRYYDPVKAREYYLRTRKLKGRKLAAQVTPAPIPRSNRLPAVKSQTASNKRWETVQWGRQTTPTLNVPSAPEQNALQRQIDSHNQKAKDATYKLMLAYEKLSPKDKKFYGDRIKSKIDDIRKENDTLRETLIKSHKDATKKAADHKRAVAKALRAKKAAERKKKAAIRKKRAAERRKKALEQRRLAALKLEKKQKRSKKTATKPTRRVQTTSKKAPVTSNRWTRGYLWKDHQQKSTPRETVNIKRVSQGPTVRKAVNTKPRVPNS